MKGIVFLILVLFVLGCSSADVEVDSVDKNIDIKNVEVERMIISAEEFVEGEMIPAKFTCQGEDVNPKLVIEGVPSNAKSLALIVDDPDAPMGTWVHWLVKDIPVGTGVIDENSVPGNEVVNDFGKEGYGGPCPPSGVHRYFFKIYALDVESFEASSKEEFYNKVEEHKIDSAELIGKFTKG